jgi:hypothetical protein
MTRDDPQPRSPADMKIQPAAPELRKVRPQAENPNFQGGTARAAQISVGGAGIEAATFGL